MKFYCNPNVYKLTIFNIIMYFLPQEVEVWYIIPAIRKELSKVLVKTHHMTLEKAGEAIGVSKAAVSQYISKKRGKSIVLPKKVISEIKIAAQNIADKKTDAFHEIMNLLKICKNSGVACFACKKFNKGIIGRCKGNHSAYKQNYD